MENHLRALVKGLERRPPADVTTLLKIAAAQGVDLPADYIVFMGESDGGDGDVGSSWLELWPVSEIEETAAATDPRYEDVLLFAGDGANTVYGFDSQRGNEIVEGDWIGLNRDQLIPRGRTLTEFLEQISER